MIPGASAPCLSTLVIPFPGVDDPATIPPLFCLGLVSNPSNLVSNPVASVYKAPSPQGPGARHCANLLPRHGNTHSSPIPHWAAEGTSRAPFTAGDTVTFSLAHLHILEASVFCLHKEAIPHVWFCGPNMRPQEGSHSLTVCTWVTYMSDLDPSLVQQNSI